MSDTNDNYKAFHPGLAVDLSDPRKLRRLIESTRAVSGEPAPKPNRAQRRAMKRQARRHGKGWTR